MTISEYKTMLAGYQGGIHTPADFLSFWKDCMKHPIDSVSVSSVPFENGGVIYENLSIACNGRMIKARMIRPVADGPHPLLLMYHDLNRGIRGWHHMTRFIALGYGVIALDAEPCKTDWIQNPRAVQFHQRYMDALILANYALTLPFVDSRRVVAWGEGFGGGLAVAVSALLSQTIRCIALNPFPGDIRSICTDSDEAALSALDYVDLANFASRIRGSSLFGVCLMDGIAKPEGQFAIYNRLTCPFDLKIYPKYAHERVNFFENEILKFLHE